VNASSIVSDESGANASFVFGQHFRNQGNACP
jgi:hypothetical protein